MTQDKIERFRAFVDRDPDNPLHAFALAQAYLEAEDHASAEATYARCLELNPDWMMAVIRRARCLVELKRWDEAREALDRGSELATKQGHDEPFEEIRLLLDELPDD